MADVKPEITVGSRWNGKRKGEEHRLVEVVEVDDHEGGYVRARTLIAGRRWRVSYQYGEVERIETGTSGYPGGQV